MNYMNEIHDLFRSVGSIGDETTIPIPFVATNDEKKDDADHLSLMTMRQGISEKISYDAIQDLIHVSKPYYSLKDGVAAVTATTVTPEMPLLYESGTTISYTTTEGKEYCYLDALDAMIRQESTKKSKLSPPVRNKMFALPMLATDVNKREATNRRGLSVNRVTTQCNVA